MLLKRVKIDTTGIHAIVSEAKKRNITLAGAKAAAKILKNAARAAAPRRTGALAQAQAVKAAKGTRGSTASYAVQGSKRKYVRMVKLKGRKKPTKVVPAFYDHLVQMGTRSHALGKGESLGRSGRRTAVRTAQGTGKHPGAKANPFRRRAWQTVKEPASRAALDAMSVAVKKEIARQAAKYAAKAARG